MKLLINTVSVKNRVRNDYEELELFQGADAATLRSIDRDWQPIFDGIPDGQKPEDRHWEWRAKALDAQHDPFIYDVFSIEATGMTQGLLIAAKGGPSTSSKHPDHPRKPIVYVKLLATAPWNRPGVVSVPLYKGIGRVLIGTAVSLSINEGFVGRIGLHSLSGSETFYSEVIQMSDLGVDVDCENLRYFELSESQVTQFLAGKP